MFANTNGTSISGGSFTQAGRDVVTNTNNTVNVHIPREVAIALPLATIVPTVLLVSLKLSEAPSSQVLRFFCCPGIADSNRVKRPLPVLSPSSTTASQSK